MSVDRLLIVNADDFGQSPAVNRGIIQGHCHGIVTSTSFMVRQSAANEAAVLSRAHPTLSIGLHLDLGEWRLLADGTWGTVYGVLPLDDAQGLEDEVARQVGAFRELIGRDPTHIDSHQHVHLREPVRSVAAHLAQELGVPLRRCDPNIGYCGAFYGQGDEGSLLAEAISVQGLMRILENLPRGITELCCHPATGEDLDTMYSAQRPKELQTLCDPRVREAIAAQGISLCSFTEIRTRPESLRL
jgi:predicted glycoside hydrolase/deacetylase ChbG (UPF0249 family)